MESLMEPNFELVPPSCPMRSDPVVGPQIQEAERLMEEIYEGLSRLCEALKEKQAKANLPPPLASRLHGGLASGGKSSEE
jgi:hypothetical protein